MPAVADGDFPICCEFGTHIVIIVRGFRETCEHIEDGDVLRRLLDAAQIRLDRLADLREKTVFDLDDLFLCAEDLRFKLLEFLRDVAFGIRQCLLSYIALGHEIGAAAAHLDVVAEDLVVTDLQGFDSCEFFFTLLHLLQHLLAVMRDMAILVEFRIIVFFDDAAFSEGNARLFHDRTLQERYDFFKERDAALCFAQERRRDCGKPRLQRRQCPERQLQRDEISRIRRAHFDARQKALEVKNFPAMRLHILAQGKVYGKLRHAVQAPLDLFAGKQRIFEPLAQKAASHRRFREVEDVEQGILLAAVTQIADDLQVTQSIRVEDEVCARIEVDQAVDMRKICLDRLMQIVKQDGDRLLCKFTPRQGILVKVLCQTQLPIGECSLSMRQGALRHPKRKEFVEFIAERNLAHQNEFRHHQAIKLIEEHLPRGLSLINAVEALTRRNIGGGECERFLFLKNQSYIVVLRIVQRGFCEHRTGRDDLYDLALRKPLRLRVSDLLGDGDLVALVDELRNVALGGMVRNAAHRRLLLVAAAARQSQPKFPRNELGVIEEHLIKIAEAKEQYLVGMPVLRFQILLHHRCEFHKAS